MNLVPVEVEKSINNVMVCNLRASILPIRMRFFVLIASMILPCTSFAQQFSDSDIKQDTEGLDSTRTEEDLHALIADSAWQFVVNDSNKTRISFHANIDDYNEELKSVILQTNLSVGFRVFVLSNRSEAAIDNAMNKVYQFYRQLPSYKIFNAPYTELKVCDFATYLEASYWAEQMKKHFEGAYVVQEVINLRRK